MPTGTKPRPAFPLGSTFTTQSAFIGRCETGRRWRSSTTAPPHWLALAVDMWTTQARCPQTHSSRRSLWRHDKKEKERTRFPTRNHPPLVLMTGSTSGPARDTSYLATLYISRYFTSGDASHKVRGEYPPMCRRRSTGRKSRESVLFGATS